VHGALTVLLADMGVSRVFLEERHPSLNERDKRLIDAIRGKKLIPAELRIDIQRPSEEPMLWMPDIVAGGGSGPRSTGSAVPGRHSVHGRGARHPLAMSAIALSPSEMAIASFRGARRSLRGRGGH